MERMIEYICGRMTAMDDSFKIVDNNFAIAADVINKHSKSLKLAGLGFILLAGVLHAEHKKIEKLSKEIRELKNNEVQSNAEETEE